MSNILTKNSLIQDKYFKLLYEKNISTLNFKNITIPTDEHKYIFKRAIT